MDISLESDDVKGIVSCDLWNALRKFANKDVVAIARALYSKGPMNLGDLRTDTGLSTNVLNHDLIEMRNVELVKKIGRKYYLTMYGSVLVEVLTEIKERVAEIPGDSLFDVVVDENKIPGSV
jgi:DNA-binding HxlR family transcriptional regulator